MIYVTISSISIFLFFLVYSYDFSYILILPMSQLQTLQLMTSQIRSHIEYLTRTYNILVLILYSKLGHPVDGIFKWAVGFWLRGGHWEAGGGTGVEIQRV